MQARATIPKRNGSGPAPLSYGQQQIWLDSQLAVDAIIYNEPVTLHRHGDLDVPALERGFAEILRRHEAWRTTFGWSGDEPIQIIHPAPSRIEIPLTDLRPLAPAVRESEALRLAKEDALRPFDLREGPLFRLRLVRLGDLEYRLFLTVHHIIFDGASLYRIFVSELVTLYGAFSRNEACALGELPIQYADFAAWQREEVPREMGAQLSYWKTIFSRLPALALKTDRPHPAVQTHAGATEIVEVPASLATALKAFSKEQGATFFTTMIAAFVALLHGDTGQDDFAVATVTDIRHQAETKNLLGFFLNTVVIRCALSRERPFTELLANVQRAALDAFSHDTIPFEMLVQNFAGKRDASRAPLAQAMITIRPPLAPLGNGWAFTQKDVTTETAKFDLHLELDDAEEALIGRFSYKTALFDRKTIEVLISRWLALLERIAAAPSRRLVELTDEVWKEANIAIPESARRPAMDPAEGEKSRRNISSPNAEDESAGDDPGRQLARMFEAQAALSPNATAVITEGESLTYRELNERANQLAHHLRSLGVGPEKLVSICLRRSARMLAAILAVLKAGGAYVPLDPAYPKDRMAFILEDTNAPLLITEAGLDFARPPRAAHVFLADSEWDKIAGLSRENPVGGAGPNNLAYVIFTSGSTGKPKGVALEHRNAAALISWSRQVFSGEELAGVLASTSICFDLSVFEIFVPLCSGGMVIVAENALALPNLPARHKVTLVNTVPSAIRELIRVQGIPSSVRVVNLAGEPLATSLVNEIYAKSGAEKVYDLYGPTETTTYSTFALRQRDEPATIGRPLANEWIHLLDEHQKPVLGGEAGEIYIGGAGVARGYLHRPELTAEKFISDPLLDKGRLYKTGDLGRWRPDGNLEFLGRLDQQVKIRGFRIELGEIEACLKMHFAVDDACVTARENPPDEKYLAAYITLKSGHQSGVEELRRFVRKTLPEYMVPASFTLLDAMPVGPNGKLDRRALPAPDFQRHRSGAEFVAPRNDTEKKIASVWRHVLKVEQIGVHDNFFDLGGHSLAAMQVISRLHMALSATLKVTQMFDRPTIASLAEAIDREAAAAVPDEIEEGTL